MDRVFLFEPVGKSHRVGLSNMLDREGVKELSGRTPKERPHRSVVRVGVMDGELSGEILEGEETTGGVEAPLVLSVATFHLAVMPWRVRPDELMSDSKTLCREFKASGNILFGVRKAIGKLEAVISLDTLNGDPPALIPLDQAFQEIGRGVSRLLLIGPEEAQARELVDSGVLEQAQLGICDTGLGNHLDVYLYSLAGIGHLLVGLSLVSGFLLNTMRKAQSAQHTEQALRAAGITSLSQPVPQLRQAQLWIPAAHVLDKLELLRRMFVRVVMRAAGLAGQ